MDGGKVASIANLTSETSRVDDGITIVGQYCLCQGTAVGSAASEDGAGTRCNVRADFGRIADICHDSVVVCKKCWEEPAANFARHAE